MVIDGYPTVAEYVDPAESELAEEDLSSRPQKWWDVVYNGQPLHVAVAGRVGLETVRNTVLSFTGFLHDN